MLCLIATPIGNLADITLRALDMLKTCDYILCEDTRHSLILLKHYDIHKPLKSYHKFNEASQAGPILEDLASGKVICLISDAGTPGISDPGADLVQLCVEKNLPIIALPGPCAAIQALSCSGLPTDRFQFWGFLARKEGELRQELQAILNYTGTTICYESPHRLLNILELIHSIEPTRHLVIGRELTKKFEEFLRGTAQELLKRWENAAVKGEIVLLFSPLSKQMAQSWIEWTPQEHVKWMEETYGISQKEAIKLVASQRELSKRDLYKQMVQAKD
jgi:16S rRNA (cytidine1402-2'-O)-methyltransferase